MKETPWRLNLLYVRAGRMQKELAERGKIEEAHQKSEHKYRLVFENASDAIFVLHDQQVIFANRRTTELLNCKTDELLYASFLDFVFPDDRQMLAAYHSGAGGRLRGPQSCTFRIVNKAGEKLWIHAAIMPIAWRGQPATLHFLRNISQQKKLEERFQEIQRMESIANLASGFNHFLMGIMGNISLALIGIPPSDPAFERIRNIEKYVQNGIELTRQLLGLAPGGRCSVNPIDFNDIVRAQNRLFKRTCSEITLHERLADGLWTTEADRDQIRRMLMNLYIIARQAMPDGGDLFVQTDNVTVGVDCGCPHEIKPGRYVRATITDTGAGMDKSSVRKIFEPFHTCPAMESGTGLGLAMVYGIVKTHGGFINVYGEKGQGVAFSVYLPASQREVPRQGISPAFL